MRRPFFYAILILSAAASVLVAHSKPRSKAFPTVFQEQTAPQQGAPQEAPLQPPAPAQTPPVAPTRIGPLVILDPGHGGSDPGARAASGVMEKQLVLLITRIMRIELERQGYRVVMTRNDDSNLSYDDRAAVANAHRDAVFISIHVSSTGTIGTARTYYYRFPEFLPATPGSTSSPAPQASGPVLWEDAQRPYADTSRHFADILGVELAQHFPGSASVSSAAPVRELRSIALPALAIEISSIALPDSSTLVSMAPPLATSIVRGIQTFRSTTRAGAN